MSGSGNHPADSRGWNHEWFGSSPFPSPDTDFSPSPQIQGLQIPGGCWPYPLDEQDATEGQYRWAPEQGTRGSASTPPLSQIPEALPAVATLLLLVVFVRSTGDPNVSTPYTPGEMEKLFDAYLRISEDAEIGTNQTGDKFWFHVAR